MDRDSPQYMLTLGLLEHDSCRWHWILGVVNIWQPCSKRRQALPLTSGRSRTPRSIPPDCVHVPSKARHGIFFLVSEKNTDQSNIRLGLFLTTHISDSYIESDFLDFEQRRVSAVEERSDDQRARGERVGSAARRFRLRAGARVPRGSSLPTDQAWYIISPTLGIVRICQVSLSKNQNFEICNTS